MPTKVYVPRYDDYGNVLDRAGRILARKDELSSYASLPPGATITITKVDGVWPGVPTNRADTTVIWKGPEPSPPIVGFRTVGQAGMLNNVDLRIVV